MEYIKKFRAKNHGVNSDTILLTGAAGYIGSHCYYQFREAGFKVVVIDRLTSGHRWLLPKDCIFYKGDVADPMLLGQIFSEHTISTVIHFAGSSDVAESVSAPFLYYKNNTNASRVLLASCIKHKVKNFIFSSSASVYGSSTEDKVRESDATLPNNPYAISKLATERVINDLHNSYGLNYVVLRYFNVAGADPLGRIGQVADNATHLIKVACEAVLGRRPHVPIFGIDYDTKDGTCIRDYIHVADVASAHLSAYEYLQQNSTVHLAEVFNCGYGVGYSVKEIIGAVERESGEKVFSIVEPRRRGDATAVVADSSLLKLKTGWAPKHDDLSFIIKTALNWERTQVAQRKAS